MLSWSEIPSKYFNPVGMRGELPVSLAVWRAAMTWGQLWHTGKASECCWKSLRPGHCFLVLVPKMARTLFVSILIRVVYMPYNPQVYKCTEQKRKDTASPWLSPPRQDLREAESILPRLLICIRKYKTFYNPRFHSTLHTRLVMASQWSRLPLRTAGKVARRETALSSYIKTSSAWTDVLKNKNVKLL